MPRVSSLHHPSSGLPALVASHTLVSSAARRDMPPVALHQHHPLCRSVVISCIQTQMLRLFARWARSHNCTVVDQLSQHRTIVDIGGGHQNAERNASTINQKVILDPRFTAICRVRSAFFFPLAVTARKCHHPLATPTQCHASRHRGADTGHGFAQRLQRASTLQNGHKRFATLRTPQARHATGSRPITHREWHQRSSGHRRVDDHRVRAMAGAEADTRSLPITRQELGGVFSSQHFTKPL